MPEAIATKRAVAFFDGQNLFHAAKESFGYSFPNYNPLELAEHLCAQQGWRLTETRFYTGVPSRVDDPKWNHFWMAKLQVMGSRGIHTYSRHLKYHQQTISLDNGERATLRIGQEKGIDVRIALDIVRLAREAQFDVALIFSQDQDLSEVADEVRSIAREHARWIKLVCAFPESGSSRNKRGINKTDWVKINKETYDQCLDESDYRLK